MFDDQVGTHSDIRLGIALCRAQAALVELVGDGLADPLFGEVALDPRVIRAVVQGRLLPCPAAVCGKVSAGVEILLDVVAGAGGKQQHE
ncbi:hypothetical protein D3C81_2000140 [compost metagenome]